MNLNGKILVSLLCITVGARAQQQTPMKSPQPAPEMRSLAKAFEGKWRISEKYEPDEWTPKGGEGHGEEVWRSGPGSFTLIEEYHSQTPAGETFGLALTWWDRVKGFQGTWCIHTNPKGCDIDPSAPGPKWDGRQLVIDTEFPRDGKKFAWHEVFSDITPTSFVQTADIGEVGRPLKRWVTIHATRVATEPVSDSRISAVAPQKTISASPEMQRLFSTQLGTWLLHAERSDGTSGQGEATWRPGPGGMSLIEDEHMQDSRGVMSGLSVTWWDDAAKGYRALWCDNWIKNGCLVMSKPAHWEGDQFVLGDEFEQNGKKFTFKEVESEIQPTAYTLTTYLGESGSELKRISTIHASKVAGHTMKSPDTARTEAEVRAVMDECREAGLQGDTERIASCLADEYRQTDISGYVQDKSMWLSEYFKPLAEMIKTGNFRWEIYERKDMQFQMYEDCAVVVGALDAKGVGARYVPKQHTWVADPNASFSGTLRFTHVYVKRDGKWLLTALHNAVPLQPPLPPANR